MIVLIFLIRECIIPMISIWCISTSLQCILNDFCTCFIGKHAVFYFADTPVSDSSELDGGIVAAIVVPLLVAVLLVVAFTVVVVATICWRRRKSKNNRM